ncbi:MAG: LytS/YhcK type 5TM receptor domain-containing protein [Bacteroidales bacterium]
MQNTAILLALSVVYEFWWNEESYRKLSNKVLTGFVIGITGIVLMLTPWKLVPGTIFDTRSVLLSVSGLFFGFIPTVIAMLMTGIFRIIQGGGGLWMGLAVIASSGTAGILWNKFRPGWKNGKYLADLVALGYVVHILMMSCTVFLPADIKKETFRTIFIPLLTIYPAGTLLLGTLLVKQYHNWQYRIAQKKLAESERRFSDLMRNIDLFSVITDTDGNLEFCNQAFLDATGYTYDELLGKNIIEIIVPEEFREKLRNKLKALQGEETGKFSFETEIITRQQGETIIVNWNYTVLKDEITGNVKGFASIGENITEKKKAEEEIIRARKKAEESDRLKSEFLANMSHEIRTSLNAIVGFSNLITMEELSEEEKKQCRTIISDSSDRLLQLIGDIIDLSKLEAGVMQLKMTDCNIDEIINESIQALRVSPEYLKKKEGIELIKNIQDKLAGDIISTDPKRVQQILDNLLSNAVKYTFSGIIETGAFLMEKEGRKYINIYVKDTGIGIPANKKEVIFERFHKLENGKFKEGAGLGLNIAKKIAELLGGSLTLDSIYGKGSTFYFTIPYIPKEKKNTQLKNIEPIVIDIRGKKIIIAEDDPDSYLYIKQILEKAGAETFHAENGVKLFEILENNSPDIILLDLLMPVIDGFEVLERIDREKNNVIIIAQTAYAMAEEKERCLALGCHGYIAKPFTPNALLKVIGDTLSKLEKSDSDNH